MMENKISHEDERKLTNAIESAATLASNDPARDRSATLASQLKEAGVDSRFAKVASAAFNKRLTVMTFKKTADEHKADPFELADADKVLELMTGESLEKAASVEAPFEITYSDNSTQIQKAASAETPARQLYEDTVRYEALVAHVESIMEKNAAALQDIVYAQDDVERKANALSSELAEHFMKNANASFEFDTLVNAYGDRFKNAIADKLPENTDFTKTAGGAILPDEPLYKKAAELVEAHEASENLKEALKYYGEGLGQFCKAAAYLGDMIQEMELRLAKTAAGTSIGQEYGSQLGVLFPAAIQSTADYTTGLLNDITGASKNILGNAYALYQAGNAAHMKPNEVLDAEFLTKDRYRDRLLGWSDMTADPQFAMYPAEQVFLATQKAMDMDTTLERPDKREVLRTYVAQLLAQNNRLSTADIAALAQTLRGLTSADEHGAQQIAVKSVKGMDETKAPEMPNLKPVIEGRREISSNATDVANDVDKSLKDFRAESKADDKEQRDAKVKAITERAKLLEDQNKENQKAKEDKDKQLSDARAARNKFLKNTMGLRMRYYPGQGIVYERTLGRGNAPRVYDQADIDAILANAEKANLVPVLPA